jgi:hypothetical protein
MNPIKWLFNFIGVTREPYTVVEMKVDKDHFRQGIRLNSPAKYKGVIVTVAPKVSVKIVDDNLVIGFDYIVHKNPKKIELNDSELRPFIGAAITDMISKDYNAFGITDS